MRSYQASSHVPGGVDETWAVLTDLPAYPAWNPFTRAVEARLAVGQRVRMRVDMGFVTVTQTETVREVVPGERLVWALDDWPRWLLWAERQQTLRRVPGGTRYHTVDRIGGVLAPLVELLFGRSLRRGFAAMATALAAEVQRRGATS